MTALRIVLNTFQSDSSFRWKVILLSIIVTGWSYMYQGIFSEIHLGHDEAGQIWMSKGLNHYTPLEAQEGGLIDVYHNNNRHNLDPGLFSYLLYFWMKLGGDGYLWLKILPLSFFMLFLYFLYKILVLALNDPIAPLLAIGLFPFSNVLLTISINIRAYSLEYAVTYGIFLFLFRKHLKEEVVSKKEALILGLVCAVFLWTRYTFSLGIILTGIYLLTYQSIAIRTRIQRALLFSLPILMSLFFIYHLVLSQQLNSLQAPFFYHTALIKYQGALKFLIENFLSLRSLPATILIIGLITILAFPRILEKTHLSRRNVSFLLFIVLTLHIILFLYSKLGFNPWSIRNPRSGHLIVFSLMGTAFIFSLVRKKNRLKSFSTMGVVLYFLLLGVITWNKSGYRHSWLYALISTPEFKHIESIGYSSVMPEYKYILLQSSQRQLLPAYAPDEQSFYLEDSRAPMTKPKKTMLSPNIIAESRGMFEMYEVRVISLVD